MAFPRAGTRYAPKSAREDIAGLVMAIVTVPVVISFAALIFSGGLSAHMSSGIGCAISSSRTGALTIPHDGPAAILALVAAAVASDQAASQDAFRRSW